MAYFNKPEIFGQEMNTELSNAFEGLYALVTGGNPDLLINAENKGYVQRRGVMNTPLENYLPRFASKWRKKVGDVANQFDVNVVVLGDSVITDMDYASELTDAPYRPPMATEKNLFAYMEEKLRWKGQQYRRWDAKPDPTSTSGLFFTEEGIPTTKIQDPVWDWIYASNPKPQTFYNGITRTLLPNGATNASISFYFRSSYRRCDLLYRTDELASEHNVISITGGAGLVTVYDDRVGSPTIGTWVEAHGYDFSAREANTLFTDLQINTQANGPALGYKKTIFQKRLKLRRTVVNNSLLMKITATDGARFGYWGAQFSTNDNMINIINAGRGSHNLQFLGAFPWAIDEFKPDLIIVECPMINEMTSPAGGEAVADSPANFASRFTPFITNLMSKSYRPEVLPLLLHLHANQKPIDETGRWLSRTISGGLGNNAATAPDFVDHLHASLNEMVYPDLTPDHPNEGQKLFSINVFWEIMRYGFARAADTANQPFAELFGYTSLSPLTPLLGGPGRTGTSLMVDGTHLNDMGNFLVWRFIEKYLEF